MAVIREAKTRFYVIRRIEDEILYFAGLNGNDAAYWSTMNNCGVAFDSEKLATTWSMFIGELTNKCSEVLQCG